MMSRNLKDQIYYDLAEGIVFRGIRNSEQVSQFIAGKLEYRKNKVFSDINHAIRKGRKNGLGKIEFEVDWIALYLKDVFKKVRVKQDVLSAL